jgi:RNA recognition motif-containing protein
MRRSTRALAAAVRVHHRKRQQVSKKIYVGNLPFSSTQEDLESLFGRHGTVESVNVIMDRETGRPRGFAFVEMESASNADDAIRALDGTNLDGRDIRVNEAQDKRGGGGGGRGRY